MILTLGGCAFALLLVVALLGFTAEQSVTVNPLTDPPSVATEHDGAEVPRDYDYQRQD